MGRKKILIGSILTIAILTLVSFSNVIGYQSVKTSQEELITDSLDFEYCKDYLFETIVEISNNPDIKEIINSNNPYQRSLLPFRRNNMELKVEHLELLYNLGLKLVDRLGKDKVKEMMENIEKPEYLDELDTIIMGSDKLMERFCTLNEIISKSETNDWGFPIICTILYSIYIPILILDYSLDSLSYVFADIGLPYLFLPFFIIYFPILFIEILISIPIIILCIGYP